MRISRIQLESFRSFSQADVELQDRVLLIAPNGGGKSTLIDAIEWALKGRCRGVDGKGSGQNKLATHGQETFGVAITMDEVGRITRTRQGGGSVTSHPDPVALLGVKEPVLTALLHGRTFFDWHHADAKDLLLDLLDVQVAIAAEQMQDLVGLGAVTVGLAEPDETGIYRLPLSQLDALYGWAFDARKNAKQLAGSVLVPDEPKVAGAVQSAEGLQKQLDDTSDELQQAALALGQLEGKLNPLRRELRGLPAADPSLAGKLTQLKELLQADLDAKNQAQKDLAEPQDGPSGSDLRAQIAQLLTEKDRLEGGEFGAKNATTPGVCVLSQNVTCTTLVKDFALRRKELTSALTKARKELAAAEQREADRAVAQKRLTDTEASIVYYRAQVKATEERIAAQAASEQKRASLTTEVQTAEAEEPALRAEVERLTTRQKDLREAVDRGRNAERDRARYEVAVDQKRQLQARVDRLEAAVDLLGPKGVRAAALADAMEHFEAVINKALAPFGFGLLFQVEPWRVVITREGTATSFDMLSKGEQQWTALAFQVALALASGLRWLAIDDVESIVEPYRTKLFNIIRKAPLDQAIVAMAAKDALAVGVDLDGIQVIDVREVGRRTHDHLTTA